MEKLKDLQSKHPEWLMNMQKEDTFVQRLNDEFRSETKDYLSFVQMVLHDKLNNQVIIQILGSEKSIHDITHFLGFPIFQRLLFHEHPWAYNMYRTPTKF